MANPYRDPETGRYISAKEYDLTWLPQEDISDFAGQSVRPSFNISFTSTTGNISSVKFYPYAEEPETGVLEITFRGRTYRYSDVPLTTAMGFSYASSATRYFNDQCRGIFDYEEAF